MHVDVSLLLFFLDLYMMSLTEGTPVFLITSPLSGFQVERRLLPDQRLFSVKDKERILLLNKLAFLNQKETKSQLITASTEAMEQQKNIFYTLL